MNARLLFVLLATLGVLLWPAAARAQLLSPGPLAGGHADLEGDDKCGRCHTSGKGVANSLCTGCHVNIGAAVASGAGLHGRSYRGQSCAKCHSDHRGRGAALVRFDPKSFDHGQVWKLNGDHAQAKCGGCHKSRSWLGLGTACTSCHKDPHAGRFGACLNCHDESDWGQVKIDKFDHSLARFQLKGAHGQVPCENCHGKPPRWRGLDAGGCASCHHDPHGGRFSKACTNCHVESSFRTIQMKAGAHPGLSLASGHGRLACGRCHDKGMYARPTKGARCSSCHKPVHEAPFGNRCESCHASIKWLGLPPKVGLAAHDKTPFPLHGKHVQTACQKCHQPEKPPQRRYRELSFDKCKGCHTDPHAGEFEKRSGGECKNCHTDSGFKPTLFGPDLHASARFPLVGHHVAVPCGKCHQNHTPGKPRTAWNVAERACEKCHENPHADQFTTEMQKHGCAGCHSPIGWDTPNIDHKRWPLSGAHASAACGRCHRPTESDRKSGKGASYQGTPRDCAGCHADVHRGQFRLTKPVKGCDACHGTQRFVLSQFDHGKLAGYPLDGAHRRLDCSKCHAIEKLGDGGKTTRWRLGYRKCRDCHADPHGGGS